MKNNDGRRLTGKALQEVRELAVRAITEDKKRYKETSKLFGVSRAALWKWVSLYSAKGKKGLRLKKRGRPKGGQLSGIESAQIARQIIHKQPDQLRLPGFLWTRESVGELIEKKTGKKLSRWTVGRYLKKWGFTPQKPMRRAYEQNPKEVKKWLENEYPAIKKEAGKAAAKIYWGDEMGIRSDHQAGCTYSKKGNTPIVKGTGQRFGCNMISTITNKGDLNFMIFEEKFTALVFIEFCNRLIKHNNLKKAYLIVDRHPVHRSKKVLKWLTEKKDRIKLFFLPGYSPELNPDELLNQDIKTNSVGRLRAKTKKELLHNVRSLLRRKQKKSETVKKYFNERHVLYAK